ncbi:MAG: Arginase [Micavibrio sp.]|nr:Arginase [Micavibrio sp.]
MKRVSLIPYVCGAGASTPGAEQGSLYCRAHGLSEKLATLGIDTVWAVDPDSHWNGPYGRLAHENIPERGSAERQEIVGWHLQTLAENVMAELNRGHRAVTLGGDHSMAAGSIAGAKAALGPDARLGLIWVDAHPDLHTYHTSASKALHGMPLGTLTGLDQTLAIGEQFGVTLKPEDIVYIGLRDIDDAERENARSLGLNLHTLEEIRERGVASVVQDAAIELSACCTHIILSIDVDGFDPDLAPATGTRVSNGLMYEEILPVLAGIVRTHSVPLIEIVEFNPTLPGAEKTFDLIVRMLGELLPR